MTLFNPSQSRVSLSLSPSAIAIARLDEEIARVPLAPDAWDSAWNTSLEPFDDALRAAVATAGLRPGTVVDVEYLSPDAVSDLLHIPLPPKEALSAAELKINDSIAKPGAGGPVSTISLVPESIDKTGGTNVFAVADSSVNAEMIGEWISRAGLRLGVLRPSRGLALLEAVTRAAREQTKEPLAVFVLEEHCAGLACAADGTVRFARSLDLGFDLLREAFARALGPESAPFARAILLESGLPRREQTSMNATMIRGDHVLPLVQPVIQRLSIELKQTLRFGLGDTEIARVRVLLTGQGARIPGLASALTSTVDVPVDATQNDTRQTYDPRVSLKTHSARQRTERRALTVKMYAGCLAAGLAVAGHGLITYRELQQTLASARALAPQVEFQKVRRLDREELDKKSARLAQLEDMIASTVGARPDWNVVLGEISRISDQTVRLDEITGGYGADAPVLSVRGEITTAAAGSATAKLTSYLDHLTASAPFRSVQLGASKSAQIPGGEFASFSLSAALRAVPPIPAAATITPPAQAAAVTPEHTAAAAPSPTQAQSPEGDR